MVLIRALTAFFLLFHHTSAKIPADFPGDETPYRVLPTSTASAENVAGHLYGYVDCNEVFSDEAKDKIEDAYYGAWLMTK